MEEAVLGRRFKVKRRQFALRALRADIAVEKRGDQERQAFFSRRQGKRGRKETSCSTLLEQSRAAAVAARLSPTIATEILYPTIAYWAP